ncbi:MAG: hydantoinase/oxoprolinase family protein [Gammaproteobacteria bacterium]
MEIFGWDIGGAHLKVARLDTDGGVLAASQIACPMWRGVGELARACALIEFPVDRPEAIHAVTMTAELCDVFPDRAAGVGEILARFADCVSPVSELRVYAGYDGWLAPDEAAARATSVASANWLALAAFTAELVGDGLLIDVGSTTTDIVPIVAGEVASRGRDDAARMGAGELVYTGVVRTPVSSVCDRVPFRGAWQPLAAETFATMGDVYRLLGQLQAHHDLMPAADSRAKDLPGSAARLARMLGRDLGRGEVDEYRRIAAFVAARQRQRIADAIALVLSSDPALDAGALVGAGAGAFVVEQVARGSGATYRAFDALAGVSADLGEAVKTAAPAVAVAKLAWMTL